MTTSEVTPIINCKIYDILSVLIQNANNKYCQGMFHKSLSILHESLQICIQNEDFLCFEGIISNRIGIVFQHGLSDPESALGWHYRHLKISLWIGDFEGTSFARANMGMCLYALRRYPEALKLQAICLNGMLTSSNDLLVSRAYCNLGLTLLELGKFDKALSMFKKGTKMSMNANDEKGIFICDAHSASALFQLGYYSEALDKFTACLHAYQAPK